ncbi:swi5-dependent recombination DNA repair protein 1 homolog [Gastrophryne carolinensis]
MDQATTSSPSVSDPQKYFGSPDAQNNFPGKQPMSSTLRERLRKMRRSFNTPCTVAKRLKIDCEESEIPSGLITRDPSPPRPPTEGSVSTVPVTTAASSVGDGFAERPTSEEVTEPVTPGSVSRQDLLQQKRKLLKQVEDKEEVLRRLKLVKLYRSKNNLTELQTLIQKWRKSSQLLLFELQTALTTENTKVSLTQLIESCGLDEKLLHYNRTEEDFEEP